MKTNFLFLSTIFLIALNQFAFSQGGAAVNDNGNPADPSAIFDLNSNSQGLLIPRMSTNERNAIPNPAIGLLIFNTDCENIDIYVTGGWSKLNQPNFVPASPTTGTHIANLTEITWNWNNVNGATGYKYNVINDYNSAFDIGTSTSFNQNSLNCETTYNLYVWSYNNCGNSQITLLSATTDICPQVCGSYNVSFNYNGTGSPLLTYGTISGQNNTCWLDRNLGATVVASSINHIDSYGDLFQWGRPDDGHQIRNSPITTNQCSNLTPPDNKFIYGSNNWYSGATPDVFWQGITGINNPCPNGWRLPTSIELNSERLNWGSQNDMYGAFASYLKFPAAGYRAPLTGIVGGETYHGTCWSSSINGEYALRLFYDTSNADVDISTRSRGASVRCIKD